MFLDREAAAAFKKKVLLEYQKKKEKNRPPSNLDAANIVLPYERNFFTFWASSIKLAAQLFKSTKLEFKCLSHLDDKLVLSYAPPQLIQSPYLQPTTHYHFPHSPFMALALLR